MDHKFHFYNTLISTNFFATYFQEQYLIDLENTYVVNIKTGQEQRLEKFLKKYPISTKLMRSASFQTHKNLLLIKNKNDHRHCIVLVKNDNLLHETIHSNKVPENAVSLFTKNSNLLIYKPILHPMYIMNFSFYTNIPTNYEFDDTKICTLLEKYFSSYPSFFFHHSYNQYIIGVSNIELEMLQSICISLEYAFNDQFQLNRVIFLATKVTSESMPITIINKLVHLPRPFDQTSCFTYYDSI